MGQDIGHSNWADDHPNIRACWQDVLRDAAAGVFLANRSFEQMLDHLERTP
ncbi:hypothetical protein [Primorskyibacter sp. S187A]|uniref:hypothetical protein n=1 Tax=Primorskyibacter sp. S187A TaxID=3415130 RepID=UPI003C79DE2E